MQRFRTLDDLLDHLRVLGITASVEMRMLTELDHGLQCAALLERDHPGDVELQMAGLIHDLAHPWDGPGQPRHAAMGAEAVRGLLGDRVAELIGGHVKAKRYLVTVDPTYREQLSGDSIMTLAAQGGNFTQQETHIFRAQPNWEAMVELRCADDAAKVPGAQVPGLDHWLAALRSVVHRRR